MEHKVVADPDPSKLTLRGGRHYLERISEMVRDSGSAFVTNVDRKMAHYYKNRMTELLGVEVIAEPGTYMGAEGYRFRTAGKKNR